MRLPRFWLHDYCRPELDTPTLAERLDLSGTKVERVTRYGVDEIGRFVVGRVLEAEPHPDADRLRVCRVEVGDGEPVRIVCGAPNVAAGQSVAVARPGAVLPDGRRLEAVALRGIVSEGMILAEDELGVGSDHDGILVLDDGLAPGTPLTEALPIATDVLELEITPNRPDCLGVFGVAREVHAVTRASLRDAPWKEDPGSFEPEVAGARVTVEVPELCPRFTARVFEDVRLGPSPLWLKARLTAAGQRPISNVVDITNFVMLLTGQPLHAFDLDRVAGGQLIVRRARDGEEMDTLDGVRRRLDSDVVIICDEAGPTSIAGIMGGARSEVSDSTTRVLLEVATWVGPNIQRTSTRLGLRSEASARFEKGLSPGSTLEAQAVASRLMIECCEARLAPGTIDIGGPGPDPGPIRLREARVERLLGAPVSRERSAEILRSLEFEVSDAPDGLDVLVPHFRRADVTREVDLIEEVARIDGMDKLPSTLPARREAVGRLSPTQSLRRTVEDALSGRGLHEVMGWSFTDRGLADRLRLPADDRRRRAISLINPMSEEQSLMRTTLLGSLLDQVRHNRARGAQDLSLFELGAVYLEREAGVRGSGSSGPTPVEERPTPVEEPLHLGVVLSGRVRPPTWRSPEPPGVDFFAAKSVLAAFLDTLRVPWTVEAESEPFLHPGRSAAVLVAGERAGWLGEVHPLVAAEWDLEAVAGFEIDLDRVFAAVPGDARYRDLVTFPAVREDLAVVVDAEVPAARVVDVVRSAGGPTLASVEVFDVYRGEQAGEGKVSLALHLEFRAPDRTLTDEEVARQREEISRALTDEVGGTLRA
jgi:phenylalanyl-tRNA synthetase beta chain